MKSIFDLKTKNSELSSANQGLANYRYQEVQSLRNIQGSRFADGEIIYRWTFGSNKYWIPSKSYLKIRIKLTKGDGNRIQHNDNVVFAMNTVPMLFQASSYKIADQTVCNVTQNLAQIDTLKNRMYHSDSWLQGIGHSTNNWGHTFRSREQKLFHLGDASTLIRSLTHDQFVNLSSHAAATTVLIAAIADSDEYRITWSAGDVNVARIVVGDIIEYQLYAENDFHTVAKNPITRGTITAIADDGRTLDFLPMTLDAKTRTVAAYNATPPIHFTFYRHDINDVPGNQYADDVELIWRPTLSIFDSVQSVIPCAGTKHEFTLTPYAEGVYQLNCLQSRGATKTLGTDPTDVSVEVLDMRFYILTCDSNKIQSNFEFMLDLNEIQCQTTPITADNQQQSLDIKGSSNAITLAFQDENALNDTRYPMSFFKVRNDIELRLQRYYIRYEGQVPQPDGEGIKRTSALTTATYPLSGRLDTMVDWYNRSKIYDGTYWMENPETLETYRARGMYLHHRFPKTASSRNTRVYIQVNFRDRLDPESIEQQPFVLLFSHYKKVVLCKVVNGRIETVTPIDA